LASSLAITVLKEHISSYKSVLVLKLAMGHLRMIFI